ncbi:restriction endonuclease [Streptomyces sp. NEAU-sy36]|nr:restriction endonuclease [Streptomyces sp. NEAU-sy36]
MGHQDAQDGDNELRKVYEYIRGLKSANKSSEERFATVLRDTIDQLLNGEVTGRYDWNDLFKTEKTHAGTLVEINLQREFKFDDGREMDYRIAGVDVDCKFSQHFGGWMIPPEALGHLCLLVWADDQRTRWSAGLMRIRPEWLNRGNNRDLKMTIKAEHRSNIHWLWRDAELPENILLHMDADDRKAVFSHQSGQQRLNELFRRVRDRRIGRNVIRSVAQQKDYMKRVRGNGGCRSALQPEGIVIMGDYDSHKRIADQLKLPSPREGEFVSTRLTPVAVREADRPAVFLEGRFWACASDEDPTVKAPALPSHTG